MSREKRPRSYKEIVEIPKELIAELPTSFDIIGDIALVKIPDCLLEHKTKIADAFLKTYKHIHTVCQISPVSGELRTRPVKIIGGEKKTETIHKEFGAKFKADIEKTYFSPRLANERKKIANQVQEGEVIVDMFTGVAPFPIIIAKHSNPKIIYAIEKNKDAVEFAKENIKINKVLDKVEIIHEDAKNTYEILDKKNVKADRVIMNLPFSAYLFFEEALKIAKKDCIIHFFDFLTDEELEKRKVYLHKIATKSGIQLANMVFEKVKSYSPREFYIRIDITAKKAN